MNILVTGGAGYIGSVLCNYLLQDPTYSVDCVDQLLYKNHQGIQHLVGNPRFRFFQQPTGMFVVSQKEKIKDYNVVIALSALVGEPVCKRYPELSNVSNYTDIKYLVSKLDKNQKVIYPCTNSGYGKGGDAPCIETDPLNPVSQYGIDKVKTEKYILDNHENSVSVRLATVFGVSPRMRFDLLVNDFVRKLYFHKKIEVFEPHFRRNAVHIRDVCRAILHVFNPHLRGVYNVGNPKCNLSKWEFATRISEVLHQDNINDNHTLCIAPGKDPDQRDYLVSNEKLLRTGFCFKYDLEPAILELATLCKAIGRYDLTEQMGNNTL